MREVLGQVEAISSSRMAASYAFAQALDAVQMLADWLGNVELNVYDINPDLAEYLRLNDPEFFQTMVERQRRTQPGREAEVRETFAQWVAESEKVLMLADLHRQSGRAGVPCEVRVHPGHRVGHWQLCGIRLGAQAAVPRVAQFHHGLSRSTDHGFD